MSLGLRIRVAEGAHIGVAPTLGRLPSDVRAAMVEHANCVALITGRLGPVCVELPVVADGGCVVGRQPYDVVPTVKRGDVTYWSACEIEALGRRGVVCPGCGERAAVHVARHVPVSASRGAVPVVVGGEAYCDHCPGSVCGRAVAAYLRVAS